MRKSAKILTVILLIVIIGATAFIIYDRQDVFNGDRVKNPDCYTLEFTKMNQTDTHTLSLNKGDYLSVDFAVDRGRIDITIGIAGEKSIYTGNDIESGVFELPIPADGEYQITVSAKHASGFIMIYAHEKAE